MLLCCYAMRVAFRRPGNSRVREFEDLCDRSQLRKCQLLPVAAQSMLKLCFALTAVKQSWHSLTLACCALLDPALARNFTDTLRTETDACVSPRHVSRASCGVWCQAPGAASRRRAAFDCIRRADQGVERSSSSRGGLWHPELRKCQCINQAVADSPRVCRIRRLTY